MPSPSKITGTVDSLVVVEPPADDLNIFVGQNKVLSYILRNTTHHVIKNITFTALLVIVT